MRCTLDSQRQAINLLDIDIEVIDEERLYDRITGFVRRGKAHKVMYLNAHCTAVSREDKDYWDILNRADLVYADGMSLVWASRLLGHYLPCRLTAADFMPRFFRRFSQDGIRVYMLGAQPGVAEVAAGRLERANPGLKIAGTNHGYFRPSESAKIIEKINESQAHIVMVGMGVPYQEKWIEKYSGRVDASVMWSVGALFDFLSGTLPRGPQWLLDSGFEWLCRLVAEPRRLWRRYLMGNLLFIWYVMQWRLAPRSSENRRSRERNEMKS